MACSRGRRCGERLFVPPRRHHLPVHHLQPRGHRLGLRVLRPAVDATVRRPAMVETSAHLRRDHLRPVCHADRCGSRPVPRLRERQPIVNCTSAMTPPPSKPDRVAGRVGVECGSVQVAKSNEARDACDVRTSWTTSNGKDPSVISPDSMRDPCPESTGERMSAPVSSTVTGGCDVPESAPDLPGGAQ